ncbi:MAG: hypothetical protein LBQ51_03490 [Desulfovibrio sp.]|jgi:hypothetical protein|nr:hypothetical protein [Desulfovibrio sp.]
MSLQLTDAVFTNSMKGVTDMQKTLDAKMQSVISGKGEVKQEDLISLQYEIGKYNTFVTALNNTVQAIQSQAKELAKSIH